MRLSDAMLQQIASLRHVEVLYLAETDVDDADLATFRSMKELRQLSLGKCVSEVAAKELQRALPHTRVEF
jgi:hypothetical protein